MVSSQADFDGLARILALFWGLLNSLLLTTAIRSCWDRARLDTIPWFSLNVQVLLGQSATGPAQSAVLKAISEAGCEFELSDSSSIDLKTKSAEAQLVLIIGGLPGSWPVHVMRHQQRNGRQRIGVAWGEIEDHQKELLQIYLYRRNNLWPMRWAPFDGLAILAVLRRLIQRPSPEDWFSRSQLPISSPSVDFTTPSSR